MNDTSAEAKQGQDRARLIEPTFHFETQFIKIGDDYTTDKIAVTQFVPAGQLLANFPDFHRFAAEGFEKAPLEQGVYVHLGEDEESILASVPGYPKVKKTRNREGSAFVTVVSIEPIILISQDKMMATIALHPPLSECPTLHNANIEKLIEEQGIIYGVDTKKIEKAKGLINAGDNEFEKFVIARGQPVGESQDAFLHYDIEIGPIAGTILEDGSIDFRDRRIMVGVKSGERIATKIEAVQGSPGINVYGEETAALEGKDIKVEILNDAHFSQETLQVTATRDGVLSIVNNNVIKVCSHQIISGDVDYETGNVDSKSSLTIQGSMQPGFKVSAGGDLKIAGGILSAQASCDGNIVVAGGITGKNSTLNALGDADINFIEQGILQSGGLVVIRKQAYYSDISAGSHIRFPQYGKVMGCRLIAQGNITLGDIGSENSKPSLIAAGIVGSRLEHLQNLKKSVVEQQDAIIQWLQRYRGSSKSKKIKHMEQELADTKHRLLRVNLIPGAGIYSRVAGPKDDMPKDDEDFNSEGAIPIENIKIDVLGTIFAETEIRIGNRTIKLEKTVSNRQFKLQPNGKGIIAKPIKS